MTTGSVIVSAHWPDDVPLVAVAVVVCLYLLGARAGPERHRTRDRWRTVSFAAAMAGIVLALGQPLDDLADRWFWAHMIQHLLLLVAVPPLLMLAAPWSRIWRGLPLGFRRPAARWAVQGGTAAPLRAAGRALTVPIVAWFLFAGDLVAWHVPRLYDVTLRNEPVHDLEHASFLAFGLLFWAQVIESPPLRCRLSHGRRIAFLIPAAIVNWVIAIVLALSGTAFYAYADRVHPPGSLSAVDDQQIGGGIMWVPGAFPLALAVIILIVRWLGSSEPAEEVEARLPRPPSPRPLEPDPTPRRTKELVRV